MFFVSCNVKVLGTLSKATKGGGTSTWDFVEKEDGTFAAVKRERQEKLASGKEDLRKLFKTYLGYGFTEVKAEA